MVWQTHDYVFTVAGAFALWTTLLTLALVYKHMRNFSARELQVRTIRILFMAPIYGILSWLSLRFHDAAIFFDLVRDSYEAYTLFQFYMLLETFLAQELRRASLAAADATEDLTESQFASLKTFEAHSDESSNFETVAALLEQKPRMKHPKPFSCFTYQPGRNFLYWTRVFILQFAIQKPLNTMVSLILELLCDCFNEGSFSPSSGNLYLLILDNLSITLAMYFLVLFYETTVEQLAPIRPLPKFIVIKSVIFFSFWQGVVIGILNKLGAIQANGAWSEENVAKGLQDFIIVVEMFVVACLHHTVFSYKEYHIVDKEPFLRGILRGNVYSQVSPMFKNFKEIADPRYDYDVTKETLLKPVSAKVVRTGDNLSRVADALGVRPSKTLLDLDGEDYLL